jgi:hypothetical protein
MKGKRKKIERQKNRTRKNERVTTLIINYFWIFNRFQKVSECSAENSFLIFFLPRHRTVLLFVYFVLLFSE